MDELLWRSTASPYQQITVVDPDTDDQHEPGGNSEEAVTPAVARTDDPELTPAIVPVEAVDECETETRGADGTGREPQRELTPDELEFDRPDEFNFQYIPSAELPNGVRYTPEFDPEWVYTSGSSDGGRQDDTPVQGLEIAVLATRDTLEPTVMAVLDAIGLYYRDTGQYPRHRVIKSADVFDANATDDAGVAVVLQPAPDVYNGLMEHTEAIRAGEPGAVDSNVETSRRLVQYLAVHLVDASGTATPFDADVTAATGWVAADQVGTLPIAERYAPLGAAEVYDPTIEEVNLSSDGVASVADAEFTPRRLSIDTRRELFDRSRG